MAALCYILSLVFFGTFVQPCANEPLLLAKLTLQHPAAQPAISQGPAPKQQTPTVQFPLLTKMAQIRAKLMALLQKKMTELQMVTTAFLPNASGQNLTGTQQFIPGQQAPQQQLPTIPGLSQLAGSLQSLLPALQSAAMNPPNLLPLTGQSQTPPVNTGAVQPGQQVQATPQFQTQPQFQQQPQTGAIPGQQTQTQPGGIPGQQPQFQPQTQPGGIPGQQPPFQPQTQPGGIPGQQPQFQPQTQPGGIPGQQPQFQPQTQPGGIPGQQPQFQPQTQPGGIPGQQPQFQPQTQPGGIPGQQPQFQPQTQPGGIPGQQPQFQPQTQPGTIPG